MNLNKYWKPESGLLTVRNSIKKILYFLDMVLLSLLYGIHLAYFHPGVLEYHA